jgi:hypothetical protein
VAQVQARLGRADLVLDDLAVRAAVRVVDVDQQAADAEAQLLGDREPLVRELKARVRRGHRVVRAGHDDAVEAAIAQARVAVAAGGERGCGGGQRDERDDEWHAEGAREGQAGHGPRSSVPGNRRTPPFS